MSMSPEARNFIESTGICVYHVPLRSFEQFHHRLKIYQRSAAKTEKYNSLIALSDGQEEDFLRALFKACTASRPLFETLDDAAGVFGEVVTDQRIRAITRLICRQRVDVGTVLRSPVTG